MLLFLKLTVKSMKKLILSLSLLAFLLSCHEDKEVSTQGQIQFSLSEVKRVDDTGRVLSTLIPAAALVVIEDLNGNAIVPQKKLPLYNFGEGYLSESIEINTGEYYLTQFFILDDNDSILYATPKEGSELAQFVDDPLPILFSVKENESTLVTPQVLEVSSTDTPESFGYVGFGFDVVAFGAIKLPPALYEKINYKFFNEVDTIEYTSTNALYSNDLLLDKTWEVIVTAWLASDDCNQNAYRYNGLITFDGAIKTLPDFNSPIWSQFYYQEYGFSNGSSVEIYRSIDWGRYTEIHIPLNSTLYYGYIDKVYYGNDY